MSKNYLRRKSLLGAVVASLFWVSAFAQQLPASLTVDELMIALRAPVPPGSPVPLPSNPKVAGPPAGSLPTQAMSLPSTAVSGYKKEPFLVATFVSEAKAIAEFQVYGASSYLSQGDLLKDGWVIRSITTDSVVMEQCVKSNCSLKVTRLEVN